MALRNFRERVFQTLSFEFGGLIAVTPIYAASFHTPAVGSASVIAMLSVAVIIWSPLHNAVFDWADLRLTGRLASDRPRGLRMVHAASHEVTSLILTMPLLVFVAGLEVWHALTLEIVLTAFYTIYAYIFHLGYDRLRPVAPQVAAPASSDRQPDQIAGICSKHHATFGTGNPPASHADRHQSQRCRCHDPDIQLQDFSRDSDRLHQRRNA